MAVHTFIQVHKGSAGDVVWQSVQPPAAGPATFTRPLLAGCLLHQLRLQLQEALHVCAEVVVTQHAALHPDLPAKTRGPWRLSTQELVAAEPHASLAIA